MQKLSKRLTFLLAFIEMFKEPIDLIDLMKLLFLYCQEKQLKYYSFFPYRCGCFSFEVYKDKGTLIKKGCLLNDADHFAVSPAYQGFDHLEQAERISLHQFFKKTASLRGDALIRKTYLEYPEYMKLSIIKERVLCAEEIKTLSQLDGLPFGPDPAIFTIGYQGISIDEYLRRLLKADIDILIDVRKKPRSMKFDFNANRLGEYLKKVSISYMGIPDLGIPANLRQGLNSDAAYQKLFELYDSKILPFQARHLNKITAFIHQGHHVALTCFERNYNHCHRHRIAEKLSKDNHFTVIHL